MKLRLAIFLTLTMLFIGSCGGGGGGTETASSSGSNGGETRTSFTNVVGQVKDSSENPETRALTTQTTNTPINVKLIVDSNKDGKFIEGEDRVYSTVPKDGTFTFKNIEIPETGTKGILIVNKDGYVPFNKIIKLKPNTPLSISIPLVSASTKVIKINRNRGNGKITIYLTKEGKIKVSHEGRSLEKIEDSKLAVTIDTNSLDNTTNAIKATLRSFNSAKREDIKYFPGEFRGENPSGSGEVGLESVAFSLVDLRDQNGNPLKLKSKRDNSCLYEVTQTLPKEAIGKIKEKGDFDNSTPGCQVPIYSYNYNSKSWDYLGTGDIQYENGTLVESCNLDNSTSYKVHICITKPNWGNYVNLDYPVYFNEVKTAKICLSSKDSKGAPIVGAWFELFGNSIYEDAVTDNSGKAVIEIPISTSENLSCDIVKSKLKEQNANLWYANHIYSTYIPINIDALTSSSDNECTCSYIQTLNFSLINTTIIAKDKSDNPLPNKEVCLKDNFFYYECKNTDENGKATFKVIPNREYTAFGKKLNSESKTVSANTVFELKESNNQPEVYVYTYTNPIKVGKDVNVYVSAYDIDGDKLNLNRVICGNSTAKIISQSSFKGYLYGIASCKFDSEGTKTISATVSDGENSSSASISINVVNQNAKPVIYGYDFVDEEGNYVYTNELKPGTYSLIVYAYDPDGDELTYSIDGNATCNGNGTSPEFSCNFPGNGSYSLIVSAKDGEGEANQTISVSVVEDYPPKITYAEFDKTQVKPGDSVNLTAYVYDPDSNNISLKLDYENGTELGSISCNQPDSGNGYFQCELKVQIPENLESGIHEFKLVASDGNATSKERILYLVIGKLNSPPVIVTPLKQTLQINLGESYTFKVKAVDPDNDNIEYTWYVNGNKKAEGTNSLTYTFDKVGTYTIKVVISDGTDSIYSQCIVNVVNPQNEKRLILHFGLEGIYVSLLDSNMNVVKTLVSDESGTVDFGNLEKDKANVAIIISPEIVLPKELTFKLVVDNLFGNFQKSCYSSSQNYCNYLSQVDTWIAEGKIPTEVFKEINDSYEDWPSDDLIDQADKDNDGKLNIDEIYNLALAVIDKNKDGKVQLGEFSDDDIWTEVEIIKEIPVKEYNLTKEFLNGYEWYDYLDGYDYGYGTKTVIVTIKNVPSYTSIYPKGGYSIGECYNENSSEKDLHCTFRVPIQEDGTYSLILEDSSNHKYLIQKDITSSSLTFDYNDFQNEKEINTNLTEKESLVIKNYYKGIMYWLDYITKWLDNEVAKGYVPELNFNSDYYIDFYQNISGNNSMLEKYVNNLRIGKTLPETIDVTSYRDELLNASISINGTSINLSGSDLSKVDEVDLHEEYYLNENSTRYGFEINVYMPYKGETVEHFPNPQKFVPEEIYNKYIKYVQENYNRKELGVELSKFEKFNWGDVEEDTLQKVSGVTFWHNENRNRMKTIKKNTYNNRKHWDLKKALTRYLWN